MVRFLLNKEKLLVTDPQKILGVVEGFYSGLYKKDDRYFFLEYPLMPRLSVDDSQACEGKGQSKNV